MNNHDKKQFIVVFKNGFFRRIKSKAFIIVNAILLVLSLLVALLPTIVSSFGGDFDNEYTIYYDMSDVSGYTVDIDNGFYDLGDVFSIYVDALDEDEKYLVKDIADAEEEFDVMTEDGNSDIIVVKFSNVENVEELVITINSVDSLPSNVKTILNVSASQVNLFFNAEQVGLTLEELDSVTSEATINFEDTTEQTSEEQDILMGIATIYSTLASIFVFVFLMMIIQGFGAQLQEEKSSGTIEVIYSSVSAKVHLFARILSETVYSIIQIVLIGIYGLIGMLLLGATSSSSGIMESTDEGLLIMDSFILGDYLPPILQALFYSAVCMIVTIFILLLMYSIIVSKSKDQEDLAKKMQPIMIVIMIPYMLSMFSYAFSGSNFIEVIGALPIFSVFLVPSMIILGDASVWLIIISFILLAITTVAVYKWLDKTYKPNMLGYAIKKESRFKFLKKKNKDTEDKE